MVCIRTSEMYEKGMDEEDGWIKDVPIGKKRDSLWRVIVVSRGCNSNYVGYPVPDLRGQPYMCTNHLHAIST